MGREKGLDFARAVSAIGIVVFHFYCHSSSAHKLFLNHANGGWGTAINYLFFALSGYLLHKKYGKQEMLSLKSFYYKRWKATIPAYVAVFLFAYLMNVFSTGKFFYLEIPKWRLALSFMGMDGYVSWVTPTYFITGEWFLGAILVAYAAYPLLRYVARCAHIWMRYLGLAILIALYCCILPLELGGLPPSTNPVTCLLCFYMGMLGANHGTFLKRKAVVVVALLISVILFAVPFGTGSPTPLLLAGYTSLIVLGSIGDLLCKNKVVDRAVSAISSLTYPVFLIHHRIILQILEGFDTQSTFASLGILLMVLISTFVFAKALDTLMKQLFKSKLYTKFEGLFLGAKRNETL